MPSRAYTSFLPQISNKIGKWGEVCQCPLGLIPHFYHRYLIKLANGVRCVNALSGLYLISTHPRSFGKHQKALCQCPLGLIPHFYIKKHTISFCFEKAVSMPSRAYTSFLPWDKKDSFDDDDMEGVNALSGLYLISTKYLKFPRMKKMIVSMPSRAYTSFLRYGTRTVVVR